MIKCDLGHIEVRGTKAIIMAEFSTLIGSLKEELPEEDFNKCIEQGQMTSQELTDSIKKKYADTKYEKLINDFLDVIEGGENND